MFTRAFKIPNIISNNPNGVRNITYYKYYPNKLNILQWDKNIEKLTPDQKNDSNNVKAIINKAKNHPIIASKQGERIITVATESHAPKMPKNVGGQKGIQLSSSQDMEPKYLFVKDRIVTSKHLLKCKTIIAIEGSEKEQIINQTIATQNTSIPSNSVPVVISQKTNIPTTINNQTTAIILSETIENNNNINTFKLKNENAIVTNIDN